MDFFKMKRKKLQSYCKKHGIPANLKNIEMAERLSLIYQGEENENHVSRRLRSDKNKKSVEIIILDSDSDTDVQIEVSDAAADIERILILDSDSDADVQMEALGTTGGNEDVCELKSASSQKMSQGQEECMTKLQRERSNDNVDLKQFEDDQELSPVTPSDLNVHHIVIDNSLIQCTEAGHVDTCEVKSLFSQKMNRGGEDSKMKLTPAFEENVRMSVNKEQIEDYLELHYATPSEGVNILEQFGNYMMMGQIEMSSEYTDVHEHTDVDQGLIMENVNLLYVSPKESNGYSVEQVISQAATTCLDTTSGANDSLSEAETSELDAHKMVVTGTATKNGYTSGAKFESSEKTSIIGSSTKLLTNSVTPRNIGFCDVEGSMQISINKEQVDDVQMVASDAWEVKSAASSQMMSRGREENMQMSAHGDSSGTKKVRAAPSEDENMVERDVVVLSEKTDVHEDTSETKSVEDKVEKIDRISIHQGEIMENMNHEDTSVRSVEQVHNFVNVEAAAMCFDASTGAKNTDENTDVAVEDNLDDVRLSSFEDSDGTPVKILPTDPNNEVEETSDLGHHEMVVTGTATKKADTSGVKFESSQKVNISPVSEKMIGSSTKLTNNLVTPKDIGYFDVVENMEIGVNKEQDAHSEVKKIDDNANVTVENMEIGVDEEQVDHSEVKKFDDSANVTVENMEIGVDEVHVDHSEVKKIDSSLIKCPFLLYSGAASGHVDACEVKSASSRKTSRCGEESTMKLTPVVEENMRITVNKEQIEDYLELHYAALSEGVNILEQFGNYMMMGGVEMSREYTDVRERTDVHQGSMMEKANLLFVSPMESSGYSVEQVISLAATNCLDTSSGVKDPLSEVETTDLDAHKMVVTGTATSNAYTSGAKFESSQKMSISPASGEIIGSSTKLLTNSVTPRNIGFCDVLMEASGTAAEKDVCDVKSSSLQKLSHGREESKSKSPPEGDDICSFYEEEKSQELHPEAPIEDDNMVDVEHEVLREKTDVDEETSGTEKVGDEAEKLDEKQDRILTTLSEVKSNHEVDSDAWEVKSAASSQMMSRGREENMQMSAHGDSSGTKKVRAAPSEDENMVERDVVVLSEKTDVHEDTSETKNVEDKVEKIDRISIHQGEIMENMNHEDTSVRSVEQVHNFVNVEAAAMCFDASTGAKNTDENTDVAVEDNLDEVRSSSFEDSDGTPDQVLPTDPTNEEETSDLGHHEMVVTGTAATNADTSGGKFESSQKVNVSPVSEKTIGSSTKLTNNSVTPKDIGFFDVVENMQIGVDEEHVDHSEVKKIDDNANVTVENMEIGVDEEQVDHSEVKKIDDNIVTVENMEIGVDEEHVDHSEVKKFDDSANVTVENMEIGVDKEHVDHSEVKKIDDNADVTVEGILNEVYSSSFENSDGTPVQVLPTGPLSEVEASDLDVHPMLIDSSLIKDWFLPFSGAAAGHVDACEVKSASSRKTSRYGKGSSQKMSISPASGEIIGSSTKLLNNSVTPRNIGFCDVEGSMQIAVNKEQVDDVQMEASDTVAEKGYNEKTNLSADHILDEEQCQLLTTSPLSEVKSDHKVDSGTTGEVMSASSQMMSRGREDSKIKSAPERDDVGSFYVEEENMKMSVHENSCGTKKVPAAPREVEVLSEKTDVYEDTSETKKVEDESEKIDQISIHQGPIMENMNHEDTSARSVEEVHNCVKVEAAAMCFDASTGAKNTDENTDVAVEDNPDEVRLSSFEDSDGTPVKILPTDPNNEVDTSDLGHHEMVVTGTAWEVMSTSSQMMSRGREDSKIKSAPERDDVGSFNLGEEKMQMSGTKNVPAALSEDEHMVEREVEKTDVHEDTSETTKVEDEAEKIDQISIHQGPTMENMNHEDTNPRLVEQVHNMDDDNCVKAADAAMCFDASIGAKHTDENTDVAVEDNLYEVRSFRFEDSDGTPVQFLPTDQSTEVETSDFDVHEMVVTGTATKNAYTNEAKFESSQKMSISQALGEMIGSSTKLQHNSMTPRDIGFCDGEENIRIGVDEEEVDHSQVKKIDENTNVTVIDIPNEFHSSSYEDSDGTPVRILPTDPSTEVETSDLDVQKMVITDILPRKLARDGICTFDMKENFKTDKKEEVGSTISKYKCAKRQPLQDLQQN